MDHSVKIIKELMQEDHRIKLIKNTENRGTLYSKTRGIFNKIQTAEDKRKQYIVLNRAKIMVLCMR